MTSYFGWKKGTVPFFPVVLLVLVAGVHPAEAAEGRTGKFTLMALGDNRLADLDRITHRCDLLIASDDVKPDVIDAFRRRNPGALVFCYVNTSDINVDLAGFAYFARIWNDTNPHEDWFHHDAAGERVKIYYPKYKNRPAFNKGNPGLQKYLADLVVRTLKSGRYDGIQLDNVMTYFPFEKKLVGKWFSAEPVNLTPEKHVADELAMLRVIMKAVADAGLKEKKIIFNHMRSGEPEPSRAYVDVTDGANCENWMPRGITPDGPWGWKAKVEQVREVGRLGKLTNLLCLTQTPTENEALFCFASYLMAKAGDPAYFFYAANYKMASQQHWYPFYDVDLGEAKGDVQPKDGGFLRLFTKGCVAVNPTAQPVTIALPGRYATLAGGEVREVLLASKGAAILTMPGVAVKPAAVPAPAPAPTPAPAVPNVPAGRDLDAWTAKIHAGWVGKVAAGSGALPTEMWSREAIRKKYGELNAPPQKPTPRGPLDDTTLAFLAWQAARKHGRSFTSADIVQAWVDHLTDADLKGGGYGHEFLEVLTRLRRGERPPIRTGSPRAEWIAAQMRAEVWGMLAPGDPARAADYATRDAEVFNVGNGVHAARFVAALASVLMVDPDIPRAVATARGQIPADSVLARMIDEVVRWHAENPKDWEATWQRFVDVYHDRTLEQHFDAWGPGWLVETGGWPEAAVLDEYRGRKDVLRTHPFSDTEPARITTELTVPPTGGSLKLSVNCNDRPSDVDWLLRVRVDEFTKEMPIRWVAGEPRWQEFALDLKPWAGKHVTIVLENAMLGKMAWEAGFWLRPELLDGDGKPLAAAGPAGRAHRSPIEFSPKILPETFSVLAGLLYGGGDFRRSVSVATMCGFDTDCNAGTVGCLLGVRNGLDAIPGEWKDPLNDTYELQVTGPPRQWRISELARQMAETAAALAGGEAHPAPAPGAAPPVMQPPPTPAATPAVTAVAPAAEPFEGFGAVSKGGEGGRVITVTSLEDSGPGTLREACSLAEPRIIHFGVEGTINLKSRIRVTEGRITIDGSTAPGNGITLLGHGIEFRQGPDDIIVRHLRIRTLTGGTSGDCLLFWGNQGTTCERVLVDHCSLFWSTDETVNTWGQARDITVQWTIIAEGTKGWLSGDGSDRITIHHCLFANNPDRNPKVQQGLYDFVNNVVYNWQVNNGAKIVNGARVNLVNNTFIAGPQTTAADGCVFPTDADKGTKVYVSGNVGPLTPDPAGDFWRNVTLYDQVDGKWVKTQPAPDVFRADKPFPAPAVTTQPAKEAYELVLTHVGAKVRDADDLRIIEEVKTRTGRTGRTGAAAYAP